MAECYHSVTYVNDRATFMRATVPLCLLDD
jgi:hypothetical protein